MWGQRQFSVLNVKALVGAFNQEKVLVGAFSVITNLRMVLFETLVNRQLSSLLTLTQPVLDPLARLLDDGPHHALRNGVEVLHLTANTSALFI